MTVDALSEELELVEFTEGLRGQLQKVERLIRCADTALRVYEYSDHTDPEDLAVARQAMEYARKQVKDGDDGLLAVYGKILKELQRDPDYAPFEESPGPRRIQPNQPGDNGHRAYYRGGVLSDDA